MSLNKVLLSWSGGKDSAMALYALKQQRDIVVEALLTTVTEGYQRISMHGVRRALLHAQAAALGLPLREVLITPGADNAQYEARMAAVLADAKECGILSCAFGDLFLEDIRAWRDRQLAQVDMTARYPLWGRNTSELIHEFLELGFKTIIVCVDPKKLSPDFVGRVIDRALVAELPGDVDPCGENGEFHTFVFDGPIFRTPVAFLRGERVLRDGFWFCDLIPQTL
ncbi:MAG: adenine nucleotide alpha hydrolase [Alphaproteobacteria bacterium]|nr:adenine nucleotide alpha hydrolase [Alphaproteobacteria bacterium]